MILYIIIGIIAIVILYVLITRNSLIRHSNIVAEAFATMDVYLKKRWDLIPNIVATVKAHAAYEKETLESITRLRNKAYESLSQGDKITTNESLSGNISKLMLTAESYPQLKADTSFLELGRQLSSTEDDIANSRKYYNAVVKNYNNAVEMFPGNLIAGLFRFTPREMFETSSSERENVEVKLQ